MIVHSFRGKRSLEHNVPVHMDARCVECALARTMRSHVQHSRGYWQHRTTDLRLLTCDFAAKCASKFRLTVEKMEWRCDGGVMWSCNSGVKVGWCVALSLNML